MQNKKTRALTFIAMFSAISAVLMFFEFPLPFLPPFLKLDLSDIPVLIGAFVFGPLPALVITLIKDVIHLLNSSSGGVGELADFLATGSLAVTAGLIYKIKPSFKTTVLSCVAGVAAMTIISVIANYTIILPFYSIVMNFNIADVKGYLLFAVIPFNLIKGIVISLVTLLVYKRLSALINK